MPHRDCFTPAAFLTSGAKSGNESAVSSQLDIKFPALKNTKDSPGQNFKITGAISRSRNFKSEKWTRQYQTPGLKVRVKIPLYAGFFK